ncbi:hypothetical protein [Phytomonospora endophytica]|uniref:Uncharacterized protein n=1 Tax=Phytomonospora endophytica TaxID=714109 RepID=A0A841FW13_9ACTN|nr:hypothetical protein [Phytomonospora endophytica]MBB6037517.1 hypothetical protein [Phytomonospora endophytica]GIG70769.1 hypothetical protein Pen01_70640 [Phytomonospora endophytica]
MAVHQAPRYSRYSVLREARSGSKSDRALAYTVIAARAVLLGGLLALVVFALD